MGPSNNLGVNLRPFSSPSGGTSSDENVYGRRPTGLKIQRLLPAAMFAEMQTMVPSEILAMSPGEYSASLGSHLVRATGIEQRIAREGSFLCEILLRHVRDHIASNKGVHALDFTAGTFVSSIALVEGIRTKVREWEGEVGRLRQLVATLKDQVSFELPTPQRPLPLPPTTPERDQLKGAQLMLERCQLLLARLEIWPNEPDPNIRSVALKLVQEHGMTDIVRKWEAQWEQLAHFNKSHFHYAFALDLQVIDPVMLKRSIANFHACLAPGATLVLGEPNPDALMQGKDYTLAGENIDVRPLYRSTASEAPFVLESVNVRGDNPGHFHRYVLTHEPGSLRDLLIGQGFSVVAHHLDFNASVALDDTKLGSTPAQWPKGSQVGLWVARK